MAAIMRGPAGMVFEFVREMGHGGYNKVLLAVGKGESQRRVAIKLAPADDVSTLRAEYEMLRKVASPFIIVAIDFLETPSLRLPACFKTSKAALVMKVAAMDLGDWLQTYGPCFDAGMVRLWRFQMASALAHAWTVSGAS